MCGRFTLKTPVIDWLCSLFPGDRILLEPLALALAHTNPLLAAPRYNISPTQTIWGMTQFLSPASPSTVLQCVHGHPVRMLRWGLVPSWAESIRVAYSMINARSETLLEKPSFRNLIQGHRCAIVADGYYEWQRYDLGGTGPPAKQPYWIHAPDEKPFAMAGLWTENRKAIPNQVLASATIITTDANSDTSPVHDRMPVLLTDPETVRAWLASDTSLDAIQGMLVPAKSGTLVTRAVSTQVNNPRQDRPSLIEALGT